MYPERCTRERVHRAGYTPYLDLALLGLGTWCTWPRFAILAQLGQVLLILWLIMRLSQRGEPNLIMYLRLTEASQRRAEVNLAL